MTILTKQIYRDYDANQLPALTITYDWNDATNPPQVTALHVTNDDVRPRNIQVTSTFKGKVYSFVVQPGVQIDQSITSGAQNRLRVEVLVPSGKLDGLEWQIS